jgi:sulfoxide reductase catalytic subunit YedY
MADWKAGMSGTKASELTDNDVTDPAVYLRRREFIGTLGGAALISTGLSGCSDSDGAGRTANEVLTGWGDATTYNNFYEFGTGKTEPSWSADALRTSPWTVTVDGACEKPGRYALEDILASQTIEERIYRLRCVEGWVMIIPWLGFPLANALKRFQPTSEAKFVRFETQFDPEQMPGQKDDVLQWPYTEGLRMDEAMHPLTLLATGMYGVTLPNQNGAPLRLLVPWKYGFKSIKSIVRISFVKEQPVSTWERFNPAEYGFYSNVNPEVAHPRWSQRTERIVGNFRRRKTLMFNGYADQVSSLYSGMDLKTYF